MPDDASATEVFAGTRLTIETTGDYTIDTRNADETGDTVLRLKPGATFKVDIGDVTALRVEDVGGWLRIEIGGGGDQRLVLGDALLAALNEFFTAKFDMHVHPTTMGPSGPPAPPFIGTSLSDEVLSDVAFTKKS